jgi:hypothetical protein
MPGRSLNRREFIKLSTLAAFGFFPRQYRPFLPLDEPLTPVGIGRVTNAHLRLHKHASYKSEVVGWRERDELVEIHAEIMSPSGPRYNRRWYRLTGGYAHSAYIQRVDDARLNQPVSSIPEGGHLGEITVPYFHSLRPVKGGGWEKLYRLYYESVHWITGVDAGPDNRPWYQITDELLRVRYYIPAEMVRLIPPEELSPLGRDVPEKEKRIVVELKSQQLTAYEGERVAMQTRVSTGVPSNGPTVNGIPTDTPPGKYRISLKVPSKHMGDGRITSDHTAYELVGVPWTCFFVSTGVGFHGTFWHDNFGTRMSHGCVNLRNQDALWLYRWCSPQIEPGEWFRRGVGTLVQVV